MHCGKIKLKVKYNSFRVCYIAEPRPIRSLEVFSVLKISADQTLDWAVRVENDCREAAESQKSPHWPSKLNEVFQITAINQIRFAHLTAPPDWQEDEWMLAVRRAAYQAYASVFCMRRKQFHFKWLQVFISANIRGNDFNASAFRT
jgi:hypothetical protein